MPGASESWSLLDSLTSAQNNPNARLDGGPQRPEHRILTLGAQGYFHKNPVSEAGTVPPALQFPHLTDDVVRDQAMCPGHVQHLTSLEVGPRILGKSII